MGKNLIFETMDVRIVPDILGMIGKSEVEGIDIKAMELFLYKNIGRPDTKIWIVFDGEKVNGFVLAYLVYPYFKPEVFVAWTYIDPKHAKAGVGLMAAVENWARAGKITRISAMIRDHLEGFEKKYGFKLESYNVSKQLEYKGGDVHERPV